ncbi:hypothetical protein AB0I10_12425 [Streptomyces sp. NPDC050636]|uniref:hypothetical protein n=1 Tax=Streptomyces sp. NPDC050636 TaxID=3154510 RepID=UPI003420F04A
MKWLLRVPVDADLDDLATKLSVIGCTLDDLDPVPQEPDEKIVYAEGPRDLPARLSQISVSVKAYPNSEFEFYN